MSKFLCSGCGACCFVAVKNKLMPDRGDGWCIYLAQDNKTCTIYDTRPLLCRVDKTFEQLQEHQLELSKKDWNIYNTRICHTFIDDLGIGSEYKISLEEYDAQ